ncbi:MAG TPA: SDR family oxidoreductase [Edaphocola sp.]|nr:SDR family oxidoreductase [Edaphocola sp.]
MTTESLRKKRALIAGSTQGIGLAIAKELAAMGADCTLISRNPESLEKALMQLPQNGGQDHRYLVADFNHYEQVRTVITEEVKRYQYAILVNNSGGPAAGPVFEAPTEEFLSAFQQHLICNQILVQAIVPGMKAVGYGRIVNIISTSVKIPLKNLGVSNTIRGAVASWAKTMSNELAPFGITVNNVLPGATATARLEGIVQNKMNQTGQSKEAAESSMIDQIPMKRFGKPEEIAAVAAFLTSPAASYLTGVSIPVDGGRTGCL